MNKGCKCYNTEDCSLHHIVSNDPFRMSAESHTGALLRSVLGGAEQLSMWHSRNSKLAGSDLSEISQNLGNEANK
jgi:hypothetical protein